MRVMLFAVLIGLLLAEGANAADRSSPSPGLSAKDVVSIQLEALQSNDTPSPDTGIERVWNFAHPSNRRMTGPLPRFARMIKSPAYRPLLGHRQHEIKVASETSTSADFAVKITTSNGDILGYAWRLAKVADGQYKGAWMTTSVALLGKLGRAI